MGAYVEHSLGFFIEGSKFRNRTNEELREFIDIVGADKTILCSDLGQVGTLTPLEGIRRGVATCIALGYSDEQTHAMFATNAGNVIGLAG